MNGNPPGPPGTGDESRWAKTSLKVLGTVGLVAVLFLGAYFGVRTLARMVSDTWEPTDDGGVAGEAVEVEIPAGASAREIGLLLVEAGVISSSPEFEREVRLQNVADQLQAGIYELETGMSVDQVIAALVQGPGGGTLEIQVIEGWTVDQTLAYLAPKVGFEVAELEAALLDGSVTSSLLQGDPDTLADWEGLLFPDSYEIYEDASATEVLQLLADTAVDRVAEVDWTYLTERGLSPYDGLIIASLIEREVRVDEERPLVAAVIFNRLAIDMPLQIDATIVYALGGYPEGGLSLDDLEIDSPYNTYRNRGLPPTPIAGCRRASLQAAAAPGASDALYYVLADSEGRHFFTADFDEFLEAQQRAREAGLIP